MEWSWTKWIQWYQKEHLGQIIRQRSKRGILHYYGAFSQAPPNVSGLIPNQGKIQYGAWKINRVPVNSSVQNFELRKIHSCFIKFHFAFRRYAYWKRGRASQMKTLEVFQHCSFSKQFNELLTIQIFMKFMLRCWENTILQQQKVAVSLTRFERR